MKPWNHGLTAGGSTFSSQTVHLLTLLRKCVKGSLNSRMSSETQFHHGFGLWPPRVSISAARQRRRSCYMDSQYGHGPAVNSVCCIMPCFRGPAGLRFATSRESTRIPQRQQADSAGKAQIAD